MAWIRNISGDDLGCLGEVLTPGSVKEVSDREASQIVGGHPQKFELAANPEPEGNDTEEGGEGRSEKEGAADDEDPVKPPINRMVDTRSPHRHYYRKDTDTCACGRRNAK